MSILASIIVRKISTDTTANSDSQVFDPRECVAHFVISNGAKALTSDRDCDWAAHRTRDPSLRSR